MALHVPKAPGFAQMLKEGARYFSGLDEAVFRNIGACKEFGETVRSAYGPNGMNKIIINHIDKLFVTSDAATIVKELEVEHPAAKMMVFASQMQEQEVGDGTNFVIIFCSALLEMAEGLIRMGMTPVEVCEGYERALDFALKELEKLVCHEIKDCREEEEVVKAMRGAIMSKQYGNEEFLTRLIAKACVSILPDITTFNVDNIRISKIVGGGLLNSQSIQGMVFKRCVEGDISSMSQVKVVVYTCPVDIGTTETKGTVLIKTAEQLKNFSEGEESLLEEQIRKIKESGANVIVSGGKFGDMALHFINRAGMMAVRLQSKFDVRRLCRTVNATALPTLIPPTKEELGYVDKVYVDEIGGTSVIVFKMEGKDSKVSTIVIRGATDNYMDDIERAIDDGVNTFKSLTRDGKLLPGAGAVELELAKNVRTYADTLPGLEHYAVHKFADALEVLPKTIADNSGLSTNEVLVKLKAAHSADPPAPNAGIDIEGTTENPIVDAKEKNIFDSYSLKKWGLRYAVNAASTILRVDQIIMAKRAGGPSGKRPPGMDEDDD